MSRRTRITALAQTMGLLAKLHAASISALEAIVAALTSTGTEIFFDKPQRHYGQTSPLSGNLTMNTTGAINGATVIIRYNAAAMGSVPASWVRLKNDFVASTDVVIVAVRFSSSIVYYTISKAV